MLTAMFGPTLPPEFQPDRSGSVSIISVAHYLEQIHAKAMAEAIDELIVTPSNNETLNETIKKYELTDQTIEHYGRTLYQIRALRSFDYALKADLGGYIEKEENLSQEGNAWVHENAIVYGNAQVFGHAQIADHAKVYGNARVYGEAIIYENALIFDKAEVYDYAQVFENAQIYGGAKIYGCANVCGNAKVYDNTKIYSDSAVLKRALAYHTKPL
jgi:NDP-sugar pyrophosphorylase family protein